ncbi:ABC transporter substrate-binding protein [Pontibacter sp. JAM-7]|uniref:ABC transporter substrate-binding protein n=1 Tax=Pontibacter sp. JAM-7 TaxID=3366581 RepID=UPI003AF51D71
MKLVVMRYFVLLLVLFSVQVSAASQLPVVRVAVLQSGTVNWELQYILNQQIDRAHGFKLEMQKMASLSAAKLALTSGGADLVVSDWLWAGKRNNAGANLRFIPFSSQIGSVLLPPDSKITSLTDLRGKKIGVAGGPMNKSWVLLQAAAKAQGVDLRQEAEIQFGAPPLLSQALRRGQVDLLATFWHYGARLETEGYKPMVSMQQLMHDLGMKSGLPILGYLFNADFAQRSPTAVAGFAAAITEAKQRLAADDAEWAEIRPLMNAESEEIFQALKAGYLQGTPGVLSEQQVDDAQVFYRLIDSLDPNPSGEQLDPAVFYRNTL